MKTNKLSWTKFISNKKQTNKQQQQQQKLGPNLCQAKKQKTNNNNNKNWDQIYVKKTTTKTFLKKIIKQGS